MRFQAGDMVLADGIIYEIRRVSEGLAYLVHADWLPCAYGGGRVIPLEVLRRYQQPVQAAGDAGFCFRRPYAVPHAERLKFYRWLRRNILRRARYRQAKLMGETACR